MLSLFNRDFIDKQGRKRPLDTPKRMTERREKGRRRDIEREGEIERGERDRESERARKNPREISQTEK